MDDPVDGDMLQRLAQQTISLSPSPTPSIITFSQTSEPIPPGRLIWSSAMEEALLKTLVEACEDEALRADTGYKARAWDKAADEVTRVLGNGRKITVLNCKHKHDNLKKEYHLFTTLINQSGFGVDDAGRVTGDPLALQAYFRAHRDARRFEKKPMRHVELCRRLFDKILATGEMAMTIEELVNDPTPSIECDSSTEQAGLSSSYAESDSYTTPRKRSGTRSASSLPKSRKVATASAPLLDDSLQGLNNSIRELVTAFKQPDPQREAIGILDREFRILPPDVREALSEHFTAEFVAKRFCENESSSRRSWVRRRLRMDRAIVIESYMDREEFDRLVDSIEWDGDGELKFKGDTQS